LVTFSALALYGVLRWATLERPAPSLRLIGLLALAVLVAGAGPRLDARNRPLAVAAVLCSLLAMLALAGIPISLLAGARVAAIARMIGSGLAALPGLLLPYLVGDHSVRLVMALGAGILLLDAAIMVAFAQPELGDLRRAGAAVPLIALAVVPTALVPPRLPYIQGLILFLLLAAFMWGERVLPRAAAGAVLAAVVVGLAATALAAQLDPHRPWLNYWQLSGTRPAGQVDTFDWTQRYGPFQWPRQDRVVLTVRAARPDYWKTENLDVFNGVAWTAGPGATGAEVPGPGAAEAKRFTQTIRVTVRAMSSVDVIAAGAAARPAHVGEQLLAGISPGTWTVGSPLHTGDSYTVRTYSPVPSPRELGNDTSGYPASSLIDELTIGLPSRGAELGGGPDEIQFPPFHSRAPARNLAGVSSPSIGALIAGSPYAAAYALATRLARRTRTPYAFAQAVERYLSAGNGFKYSERPPVAPYPIQTFLLSSKRGYCQQFAGAMALLLRMGGVPARVVTGFTSGAYDSVTSQYVVSDADAHAWVEVWFPRYGWVRFDPTPLAAPARAGNAPLLPGLGDSAAPAPAPHGVRGPHAPSAGRGSALRRHGGSTQAWPLILIALALAALLGAVASLARGLTRAAPTAQHLVEELERALVRTRRPLGPGVTLEALEARFGGSPAAQGYLRGLKLARFAGRDQLPPSSGRRALRRELGAGLGPLGALRAWWGLPPSRITRARQ
jgi:transglutaminase-like putative cysteine protease